MLAQVVDAVVVVDGAVLLDNVLGAQTVLDHKQRLLVTVVQIVEGDAEAQRIDGPAPLALLQVGVLSTGEGVALGLLDLGVVGTGRATGAVVAKADEVDGVVGQNLAVLVGHAHVDTQTLKLLDSVGRVIAAALNVDKEVVVLVVELRLAHVARAAAVGVVRAGSEHAADLNLGVDLVSNLGSPSAGDKLVVGGQILDGLLVLALLKDQAGTHKRQVQDHVDLVKGEPVLHQALVAGEDRGREVLVEVDELAVAPAAVLLDEMDGAVEVRDGHERLDAMLLALAEHVLVKGQAGLVGLGLIAVGEDAGPGQAHAEGLKAHLGKEGDVLLVAMVKIDAGLRGIVVAVLEVEHLALAGDHRVALGAVRSHVHVGQTAAVHVVGALALVGSRRAAPQEVITESHASILSYAACRDFSIPANGVPLNGSDAGRHFFSRIGAQRPSKPDTF